MEYITALLLCLAAKVTHSVDLECPNTVSCPCGNEKVNVTVCIPDVGVHEEVCTSLSKCENCEEGHCSKCLERLAGPFCSHQARRPDHCHYPGDLENGQMFHVPPPNEMRRPMEKGQHYPPASRIRYSCDEEFILDGPSVLDCQRNGSWSAKPATCVIDITFCENLGPMQNGRVQYTPPAIGQISRSGTGQDPKLDKYPEGAVLRYNCDEGYNLLGRRSITCRSTGSWSSQKPVCEKEIIYCDSPGPLQNGNVQYFPPITNQRSGSGPSEDFEPDEYPEGGVLEFKCDEDYRLFGSGSLTCKPTGSWSAKIPVCELDCGHSLLKVPGRGNTGGNTISGEWPWVVSISVDDNENSPFICGGAVLNTYTVLTAAHCLESNTPLLLRFGKHNFNVRDDDNQVLTARSSRIIIHPNYSNTTLDSDIALIIFHPRIRYSHRVQPICLPTRKSTNQNIQSGEIGYVGGWGVTDMAVPPEKMMLASLPVVSNRVCMDAYRQQNLVLTRNMFCAGHEDARESVCEGDSGSPFVFYETRSERYTLEGLVSFGVKGQCSVAGKYAIFTKVFRFARWIIRNMK